MTRPLYLLALLCWSCNGEPPPRLALKPAEAERRAIERIALLPPEATKGAREIGPVEGSVCKVGMHDPDPSKDEALGQLRIAAVRAGANAVVGTECEEAGTSLLRICFASITCRGTAIRVAD